MAVDPTTGQTQYLDPATMAALQAQQSQAGLTQDMAQKLMNAGYIPNSGKMGGFAAGLQTLIGALMQKQALSQMQEASTGQLKAQQAAAIAARAAAKEDARFKTDEEIYASNQKKRGELQAGLDLADPLSEAAAKAAGAKAGAEESAKLPSEKELAKYRAQVEAANRQTPEFQAKIALAQKMGASPAEIKAMVLGQSSPNAPSGYEYTPEHTLHAITGGPADPEAVGKAQPISSENRTKLGLLNAAQSALDNFTKGGTKGGTPTPWANTLNRGPANTQLDEAIANVLRVESGAAIGQQEIEQARARYAPGLTETDDRNKAKLAQLQKKIADMRESITAGTQAGGISKKESGPTHYKFDAQGNIIP